MGRAQVIVLDTHIFIWYALDDPRLNKELRDRLRANPSGAVVPSICIWEAMLLVEKGRLAIADNHPGPALRSYLALSGFSEAPISSEIAILSRVLEFEHEDSADRFIAATAYSLGAELATADERLRRLKWVQLAC